MGQLHGHIIAINGKVGIVTAVKDVKLNQPDVVLRDANTGEEVDRTPLPQLDVQQVHVFLDDGTEHDFTEHVHPWIVLGSVQGYPEIKDADNPPSGAFGELQEQQDVTDAFAGRVAAFSQELRDAAPLAEARRESERNLEIVSDGEYTIAGE